MAEDRNDNVVALPSAMRRDILDDLADMIAEDRGTLRRIGEAVHARGRAAAKTFLEELVAEGDGLANNLVERIEATDPRDTLARGHALVVAQSGLEFARAAEHHADAAIRHSPELRRTVSNVRAMAALVDHASRLLLAKVRSEA